ncbi:MAG TPA: RsmG family class I SAM-dependent methyltransferase [Acidimicrobiia bacterium]
MNPRSAAEAAAEAVGVSLDPISLERLSVLGRWLAEEAVPAGGVGPNEAAVIGERHVADSILFAAGWRIPPSSCWDLGSGVGLPGLVLASIWPGTKMVLVDSSQRRCTLARRGARVLGVSAEVQQSRIEDLTGPYEAIVSRATVPAERFRPILTRLLEPGGRAVISGSGETKGFEPLRFPTNEFFDRNSRLLMMRSP